MCAAVQQWLGMQREVEARQKEDEERHGQKGKERVDRRDERTPAIFGHSRAQREICTVDEDEYEDRRLARIPIPPCAPRKAAEERTRRRGKHHEEEAELRRACAQCVEALLATSQEAKRPPRTQKKGENRDPRRRNMEEDEAHIVAQAFCGRHEEEYSGEERCCQHDDEDAKHRFTPCS